MVKKYGDIISGVFVIAVAIGLYMISLNIKQFNVVKMGADFVPKLVAIIFGILGLILLIKGIKGLKGTKVTESQEEDKPDNLSAIATLVLLVLYVALLDKIGFVIMTIIYLFVQFIIVSKKSQRKYIQFAVLSVVISLGAYYLFVDVFRVMIPNGILG